MKPIAYMASAFAVLGLTACDAVKVPEIGNRGEEPPVAAPEPVTSPPSETTESTPDTPGDSATTPDPMDVTVETPTNTADLPDASALPMIESLREIAATTCGLPEGAEPTETISVQANAKTGPQPESFVGIQAVGAIAVSTLTAFPGIVKMEPRRFEGNSIASGHCGATRIADRWFVTAAHCVDQAYDEIQFIAGTINLKNTRDAEIFTADVSICHDGYAGSETNYLNDIALIRIPEETVDLISTIPIANYGRSDRPLSDYHYETAEMAGWGMTGYNQPLSTTLLSAELNLVSASPSVIVINSRGGSGPCVGDSGGPLYITEDDGQKTVIGVLSVVEQASGNRLCEGDYRGRYTNLQGYHDWIDRIILQCEAQPDLCVSAVTEAAEEDDDAEEGTVTDAAVEIEPTE